MLHCRAFSALLTWTGIAAAVAPARAQGKTVEVTMRQSPAMRFVPEVAKISVGDTVTWTNPGYVTHDVTFNPGKAANAANVALPQGVAPFGSEAIQQDGTFSHVFTVKGTYKYVCTLHENMGMVGTVIVS
jgi:plastocyanin